jgi:hypothetical protein
MTGAERQRKRRTRLAGQQPAWAPEYSDTDWRHNRFVDQLHDWLEYGDIDQVTELLAEIGNITGRWEKVSQMVTARLAELDREAITYGQAYFAWKEANPDKDDLDFPGVPEGFVMELGHGLEWEDDGSLGDARGYTAKVGAGNYYRVGATTSDIMSPRFKVLGYHASYHAGRTTLGAGKTAEEAKAIAQAHYDKEIVRRARHD